MILPLAITMGDPAGIATEVTIKSWLAARHENLPCFYVIGDIDHYHDQSKLLGLDIKLIAISSPIEAKQAFNHGLPILSLRLPNKPIAGKLDKNNSNSVIKSIDMAVEHVKNSQAGAIVTNPIQKSILYDVGFCHSGHTEYLGELAGKNISPVMMLACDNLRVVPVTIHMSLADAIKSLCINDIVKIAKITATSLRDNFNIDNPKLAIAALNPHAGENGAMGDEEITIIKPAVDKIRDLGIDVTEPLPADTLFHIDTRKKTDAVICMYHDQALIPLKTIDFFGGVNITLGLPFIRTSPDHGTALDIAGKGIACAKSMIIAIQQADFLSKNKHTI